MYEDKQWQTIVISGLIIFIFTVIYLAMNQLAKFEENQLRATIFDVQESIAQSMSTDYDTGLGILESQIDDDRLDQAQTRFLILDDLIKEETDAEALTIIGEMMKYHTGDYALFNYNTLKRLEVSKKSYVYVPSTLLTELKKTLRKGEVVRKEGAILKPNQPAHRPGIYFYWLESKNWIIACESMDDESRALKERAKALIQDNFNDVDGYLNYELLVLDEKGVIVKCSEKAYIGRRLLIDSNDNQNNLSRFRIIATGKEDIKMVGNHILAQEGNVIFAMNEKQYSKENLELHRLLQFILVCNLLLGINVVRLLSQNYLYYLESRKKEGGLE